MKTISAWRNLFAAVVIAAMSVAASPIAQAQQSSRDPQSEWGRIPPIEIAATFTTERSKITQADCGCFWLQGGSAEANVSLFRDLSATVTLTGLHAGNVAPGVDVSQIAVMAGPRYAFRTSRWTSRVFGASHRTNVFGEALFGAVHAFDGLYPTHT